MIENEKTKSLIWSLAIKALPILYSEKILYISQKFKSNLAFLDYIHIFLCILSLLNLIKKTWKPYNLLIKEIFKIYNE